MENINTKEAYRTKNNLLIAAAIFTIIKYCLFISLQINFTVDYDWSGTIFLIAFCLYLSFLIISITLFILLIIYTFNFKENKIERKIVKVNFAFILITILTIILINIFLLIYRGAFRDALLNTKFFDDIIKWTELMYLIEVFIDLISILIIVILTDKIHRKRIGQTKYGRCLVTPWFLIPVLGTMIGLLPNMFKIFIEHWASKLIDLYFWNTESSPFPTYYTACFFALCAYGIVGISIGIELLIKCLRARKTIISNLSTDTETDND
ncbi:MAG TPA: hypothetical protein VMX55_01095 [candidate division Zixibacteria bacterium]|nr:hypothetical protein [candidate division Zixibacteria bacterium]